MDGSGLVSRPAQHSQSEQSPSERLLASLHATAYVSGLTHNFYRYPARMFPGLARELILSFSNPHDYVLDPFMGGGTTIVEALACGRKAVGIDINSLAHFVSIVKSTPLSEYDNALISIIIQSLGKGISMSGYVADYKDNNLSKYIPNNLTPFFGNALEMTKRLPFTRQQMFAKCVLLRLAQWALDNKSVIPDIDVLNETMVEYVHEMAEGLHELVTAAKSQGVRKNSLTARRLLAHRSAVGAESDRRFALILGKPRLVVTSPPYPGVHVLYHRWQVGGRRETPAPYWFTGGDDGHSASYYTLGSRTPLGLRNYFNSITAAFRSVRMLVHPSALVVQLVAFSDVGTQLPQFLDAMREAGFCEASPSELDRTGLWRTVPNRKWYYRVGAVHGTTQELLLFHRPCVNA